MNEFLSCVIFLLNYLMTETGGIIGQHTHCVLTGKTNNFITCMTKTQQINNTTILNNFITNTNHLQTIYWCITSMEMSQKQDQLVPYRESTETTPSHDQYMVHYITKVEHMAHNSDHKQLLRRFITDHLLLLRRLATRSQLSLSKRAWFKLSKVM